MTFRTLSERLATGPGAIYWHIANKSDLLTAACDAIVARTMNAPSVSDSPPNMPSPTPEATIRAIALGMFDAIDAHPWVGSALASPEGQMPMVRILERLGQQVHALDVPQETQWAVVGALLNYILGVGDGTEPMVSSVAREASTVPISWTQWRRCGLNSILKSTRSRVVLPDRCA